MTRWTIMLACVLIGVSAAPAAEPLPLRVLYVGTNKGSRSEHFEKFLKQQFREARVVERQAFKPTDARDADVVLFDWSQSEGSLNTATVPLGKPEEWSKPTVLLNHAGLLVAAHWQLIGGAG
jgi:hypothetical protein